MDCLDCTLKKRLALIQIVIGFGQVYSRFNRMRRCGYGTRNRLYSFYSG